MSQSHIEVSESMDTTWRTHLSGRKGSVHALAKDTVVAETPTLSPRECGILELIGQGYSNKRVARALGITAETVKWYVKRVFLKRDVNTRAHAVARAQSLGLFGLDDSISVR